MAKSYPLGYSIGHELQFIRGRKAGCRLPPPATPKEDPVRLIGRGIERRIIREALASESPELVAVWGRRRVGKTFLIRQGRTPSEDHFFEVTGRRKARRKEQLGHFMD